MAIARRVGVIVHGLLGLPPALLVGLGLLAFALQLTDSESDPHGFATAIALLGAAVAALPLAILGWLVIRWWREGAWLGLLVFDLVIAAFAAWALRAGYSPGVPAVAATYVLLAVLGAAIASLTSARREITEG